MSEQLPEQQREAEPELVGVAVAVPGILGHPYNYLSVLELPAEVDLPTEWATYNSSAGRVYVQNGSTVDHRTVMFDDWLVRQHRASGATRQALQVLEDGVDPSAVELSDGLEPASYFTPDFSELAPYLR